MQFICRLSGSQDQSQSQQRVPFSCYGTRSVGRGTRKMGGRGSCRAETTAMANSEWRMVKRQIFWRAVLLHCRKKICLTIALRTLCSPLHACTLARTSAEASGMESFRTRFRSLYIGQGSCYNGRHTPCVGCECCCSKTILGGARRCWVGRRSR